MKKLLCVLMALCLMTSFALAESAPELNWEDFEPIMEQAGISGEFYTFDEIAVAIWIPEGLEPVELTDEAVEAGCIAYFTPEDESASVTVNYVNADAASLEEYAEALPQVGAEEIEMGLVNGLPCVSYNLPEQDAVCAAFTTEAGYILEVACWPMSEEGSEVIWGAVAASIQAVE